MKITGADEIRTLSEAASANAQVQGQQENREALFTQPEQTKNADVEKIEGDNGNLSSQLLQKMYSYASAYSALYSDARFEIDEDNLILQIKYCDNKKEIDMHFDESGEKLYTEFKNGNGDYNLSDGIYGKNKEEATATLINNFMSNGAKNAELVGDKVVANYEGFQMYYIVKDDGTVNEHGIIGQKEDFIPTKNDPEKQQDAKTPAERYANTYRQIAGENAIIEVLDDYTLAKIDENGEIEVMITVDEEGMAQNIKYAPQLKKEQE